MSRSLEAIAQQFQCAVEGIVGSEERKAMPGVHGCRVARSHIRPP